MALYQQLKQARHESGLSQTDVSKQLHTSRQTISQWENGKSTPDIDTLKLLSTIYNRSLDELINDGVPSSKNTTNQVTEKPKDEGLLLLLLTCLSFLIAPVGLIIAPLIIWTNKSTNAFYKAIYFFCIIAIIYNLCVGYSFISDSFNWGTTSYY
ncbi:helix-turn-helix domain-containing protein [Dellaglioa sp. BT-FLS60]